MNVYVTHRQNTAMSERFDPLRLHQSVVAACRSVRSLEGDDHLTAQHVCEHILTWLATKTEVTAQDIRRMASRYLASYHPDAAYMYSNDREML